MDRGNRKIGVVGGGIGGCSAAYFAREELGEESELVLFEKRDSLGGRIRQVTVDGHDIEVGAKWFHETHHRHLLDYVDELGLGTYSRVDDFQPVGVWTGDEFVTLKRSLRSIAGLIARYGLDSYRVYRESRKVNERLANIYRNVRGGEAYETSAEMMSAAGLETMMEQSGPEYFRQNGFDDAVVDELITGVSGVMTGHSPQEFHALVTVAPLTILTSMKDLRSIRGGNTRLCYSFVEAADATVRTNTDVQRIQTDGNTVTVATQEGTDTFDEVIIAVPLEQSGLRIDGASGPIDTPSSREFNQSDVAIIEGEIEESLFGTTNPPTFVLSGNEVTPVFSTLWRVDDGLYELIAPSITDALLDEMFATWTRHAEQRWQAWPLLTPPVEPQPFELAPDVYYVNAVESCFSTMAMSTLGARNTVNMIING